MTLRTICGPDEREYVERAGPLGAFVAKESVLKAGGGTIEQIAEVRLTHFGGEFRGVRYYAQEALPKLHCAVAMMTSEPIVDLEFRALEWDEVVSDTSVSSILAPTSRAGREA